jgi:hypothetical protein
MKRYYLIPFIAMALGLTACDIDVDLTGDDYLNRTPLSTISPENYFRTETDLQLFSNTFYNNLLDKEPFEEQSDHYLNLNLASILRGGNDRTVPIEGGGWSWGDLRKMNTLLGNIDKCDDEAAVVKYTALTRFFRAYFYFEKIKRFGDVPWIDHEVDNTDAETLYAPRDSRETVMQHMIEDIDYAVENLPSAVSTYRVNKWTALALKARFCLFEGTFRKYHDPSEHAYMYVEPLPADAKSAFWYLEQAADAAGRIISGGPYRLASDYRLLFANPNADAGEYMLAIKNDQSLTIFNNSTAYATMPTQGCPGLTKKFVDAFLMADGSRFTDRDGWQTMQFVDEMTGRDPRLAMVCVSPGYIRLGATEVSAPDLGCSVTGYQVAKFVMDETLPGVGRVDMSFNDMPVFRLGEVYLNYAEAKAELGTLTQNDLDVSLNLLRDRVGMPRLDMEAANANPDWYLSSPEYGYQHVTGANKGVILEIRRERSVELCQEGFRLPDLVRWREGGCISQTFHGAYFPGPGEYDLTGDGKPDIRLYLSGDKPANDLVNLEIGSDTGVLLSDGNSGYLDHHKNIAHVFDENRDYYYPVPTKERSLNPNLKQNPGWKDGLDY